MSVLKPMMSVVDSLLREHKDLLAVAERKKDILIKGDMEALGHIGREEVAFVHRIERLEAERLAAARLLALRAGVPAEAVKPDTLLRYAADQAEAAQVSLVIEDLRSTLDRLKQLNDLNKQLIEQSLTFIETTVSQFTESPQVPTYGQSGESNSPYERGGRTSFFDSKA